MNEITFDHFSFTISSHIPLSNSSTFTKAGDAAADDTGVGVPPSASVSSIARDNALFIVAISAVISLNFRSKISKGFNYQNLVIT